MKVFLKLIRICFILILTIFIIILFIDWQNNSIKTTNYQYINSKIPNAFHGFKILQIADLHNKEFKEDQSRLLNKVIKAEPDIIVITGDLFDRNRFNLESGMKFIRGAVKIAPVYYVSGNHEAWSMYDEIIDTLEKEGVITLEDKATEVTIDGSTIGLLGVADPLTTPEALVLRVEDVVNKDENDFKILLSHRPEYIDYYVSQNINLVFSGHAHGGQIRLPFIGGLYSPGEKYLPKYTCGIYKQENTSMVVSRGLGNSVFPVRLFNRPEIVVVTLLNN